MQISLQYKGQVVGPFSVDQVRERLAMGECLPSDLAWYEGAPGWVPLTTVPGVDWGVVSTGPPRTSTLAIWSLVLGILSLFCGFFLGIPAVICGHLSLSSIKKSRGAETGSGLAIAGLITGYIGTFIVGIAVLAGLAAPMVIRQKKMADRTEAINNARQLGLALYEFSMEFDDYPNEVTAPKVAEKTSTAQVTGDSSNARFRQLLQSELVQSETVFYSKSQGSRKPDNSIAGSMALEKGECGFAFVGNLDAKDATPRPLAMTPMVLGTDRFDPMPFEGKAVILWTDNSVKSIPIDRASGEAMLDGKNMLDPSHPVWGGKAPLILWPE